MALTSFHPAFLERTLNPMVPDCSAHTAETAFGPYLQCPRLYLPFKATSNIFSSMGLSQLQSLQNRNLAPFSVQTDIILSKVRAKGYGEFPHFQGGKSYQESRMISDPKAYLSGKQIGV
jgi:hypothetical protein